MVKNDIKLKNIFIIQEYQKTIFIIKIIELKLKEHKEQN